MDLILLGWLKSLVDFGVSWYEIPGENLRVECQLTKMYAILFYWVFLFLSSC